MAGKGSKPRNCFSQEFRDNYDEIFNKHNLKMLPLYRVSYTRNAEKTVRYAFFREVKNEQDAINKFLSSYDASTHKVLNAELYSC